MIGVEIRANLKEDSLSLVKAEEVAVHIARVVLDWTKAKRVPYHRIVVV